MLSTSGMLLLCATLAIITQGIRSQRTNAALPNQHGLARLFFASRIAHQDPMTSMACFGDYIAESNEISGNYSNDYNNCLVKATESRKQLDNEAFAEREGIVKSAEEVCMRMRTCNTHNNTLDMFNCHAHLGANNTKATYTISGNASEYATVLQESYRLIELHHEKCCHTAERAYVENTAQNYNYLQACLDGRAEPRPPKTIEPTTTTTTTTSTTTTTTTPVPESTTTTPVPVPEPTTTTTELPISTSIITAATETSQRIQEQFAQLLNLLK